jgi:FkbM family methyltransferase
MNWAGFGDRAVSYRLRHGGVVHTEEGIDGATVGVVFVREDYGPIDPTIGTVVDIGANIGAFALLAAWSAPNARVLAFEPMRKAYGVLARNVSANGLGGRIEALEMGVAGTSGPRQLHLACNTVFNSLYGTGTEIVEIDCISLDDVVERFGLESIDILKVDCEGAEYEILYQASPATLAGVGSIRMEYHPGPDTLPSTLEELTAYLARHGLERTYRLDADHGNGIVWFERSTPREVK